MDEHADLLRKGFAGDMEAQADGMDEETWQAVRTHAAARRVQSKG